MTASLATVKTLQEALIAVPEGKDEACKKAKELNILFKQAVQDKAYAYAQPVCLINEEGKQRWHVRVRSTEPKLLEEAAKNAQTLVSQQEIKIAAERPCRQLEDVVVLTIKSIRDRNKSFCNPDRLTYKLTKTVILLLKTSKWPFNHTANDVRAWFSKFIECPPQPNQIPCEKFISDLNKGLRLQSLTLTDISLRIATKQVFAVRVDSMKADIELGLKLVVQHMPKAEQVDLFTRTVALNTNVYNSSADKREAKEKIQAMINRLVEVLVYYDAQNKTDTLFNFLRKLMERIISYYREKSFPKEWLAAQVTAFEALVVSEQFLEHMTPYGEREECLSKYAVELFSHEETWQGTADLIVALGNPGLFQSILACRVDMEKGICRLEEYQIDHIFFILNKRFHGISVNGRFKKALKEMFTSYLNVLSRINRLHLLKGYARHPGNTVQLRQNLKDLDCRFMEHQEGSIIPLESFFGNAAYRAVDIVRGQQGYIERTCVRLFSRSGDNPIKDENEFSKALKGVLELFNMGFDLFTAQILGKMGELVSAGKEADGVALTSVEKWLVADVLVEYHELKELTLKCFLGRWNEEHFNGSTHPLNRFCWHSDTLHVIEMGTQSQWTLKNFMTGKDVEAPKSVLTSDELGTVKKSLEKELAQEDNRTALSVLTIAYMTLHHHEAVKRNLEKLLSYVFNTMRADCAVKFHERMTIVANFFDALAPFFKQLDDQLMRRFFNEAGRLKNKLTQNLIQQAARFRAPAEDQLLHNLRDESEVKMSAEVVKELSQLFSPLIVQEVEAILKGQSLPKLKEVSGQLENVICRKVDELTYANTDFIDAFCKHRVNREQAQVSAEVLRKALGELVIKEAIIKEFGDFLKQHVVPIHFILPNQAIAMQLCTCEDLIARNLFLKMGTGQGKSLVIAVAALNEAKKIRDKVNGRVWVFTCATHLAKRDHEFGQNLFRREKISSLCITGVADLEQFTNDVKIVYADFDDIEAIVRNIMARWLQNKRVTDNEKNFIKAIYGTPDEDLRLILDEYDLLIYDLENRTSVYINELDANFLDRAFVDSNKDYCPSLLKEMSRKEDVAADHRAAELSSGKDVHYINIFDARSGKFHLPVAVLRLANIIKRAKRVIGLSGSAEQNEAPHAVPNPLFFEIPSSHAPEHFGTKIGTTPGMQEEGAIWCQTKKIITGSIKQEKDAHGDIHIVSEADVKEYCQTMVKDVQAARDLKGKDKAQRPVLIFADPYFRYKTVGTEQVRNLWTTLNEALQKEQIQVKQLKDNVTDKDLQMIGKPGEVTMATIKYGRGADIRISLDIDEGLHVVVGSPVLRKGLLIQLIGRGGRMGRKGSHSIITLGEPILPPQANHERTRNGFQSLHEITKFFIDRMFTSDYDATTCKQWVMFLRNNCSFELYIKKSQAKALCGNFFPQNVDLKMVVD